MSNNGDNNSNNKGTFQLIAEHMALAVQPLNDAMSDLESFQSFMLRLGWEVTSIPLEYTNLANLVNNIKGTLDSFPEKPSISQVKNLLESVRQLFDTIKGLSEVPAGVDDAPTFLAEIGERLFELLLTDYLAAKLSVLYNIFVTLGIIEREYNEETETRPAFIRTRLKLEQISTIISDPVSIQRLIFGWGTDDFQFAQLAQYLQNLLLHFGVPASIQDVDETLTSGYQHDIQHTMKKIDTLLDIPLFDAEVNGTPVEVSISLLELPSENSSLPGIIIQPVIPQGISNEYKITEQLTFRIRAGSEPSTLFGILIRPNEPVSVRYPFQPGTQPPPASLEISLNYRRDVPIVLLGSTLATRLQMGGLTIGLNADFLVETPELRAELAFDNLELILANNEQDSLMSKLFDGNDLRIPLPLVILWSTRNGLHFKSSSGVSVSYNPHLKIGGVQIDKLTLQLLSGDRVDPDPNFAIEILIAISGSVGPVSFSMDGIGLQLKTVFKDGNAGPIQIGVDVVPPHGVGLAINANGVKGGGFISRKENQYSGVIDLNLRSYPIQALVILKTDPSISILFAIFAEFRTPKQLGGGWKITKIGGMLGINHTVSHNSIASGIKSGILDTIMFPANVISNAPAVISNFETVFPVLYGQNIIGPAIRIAYGTPTLITGDVAVILEFPNPFLFSVLGKITSKIPNQDDPIVQINIGALGALDLVNGKAEVYGSLYDSRVLNFSLSGDMAMALSWGLEKNFIIIKNFIFSIGGFNPKFTPPPNFPPFGAPPLKRLNLSFSSNVSLECYMALTSNTFQVGAKIDAVFSAGGATISGYLEFHALVQFSPLHFIVDIEGGMSVKYRGVSLVSVKFSGSLEGPNTYRIKGSVRFSIFWLSVSKSVDKTFGDPVLEVLSILDPWPLLRDALRQNDSWSQDIPTGTSISVSIKDTSDPEDTVQLVHPFGNLKMSEKVVPLNHTLTKFGTADPKDNFRFEIVSLNNIPASDLLPTQDYFAPAHFTKYDSSELLTLKSYDLMDSGVFYTSVQVLTYMDSASYKKMSYETIILGSIKNKNDIVRHKSDIFSVSVLQIQSFVMTSAACANALSNDNSRKYWLENQSVATNITKEKFVIVNEDDNLAELPLGANMSQASAQNTLLQYQEKQSPR